MVVGEPGGPVERTGARLALANARRLVTSADILARHRRYDHALSLLVIAFQEQGKAVIWSTVADGLYEWKEGKHGQTWFDDEGFYFDPAAPDTHRTKAEVLGVVAALLPPFAVMLEIRTADLRGRLNMERLVGFLGNIPQSGPSTEIRKTREGRFAARLWEAQKLGSEFMEEVRRLEARRLETLYVDIRNGTLTKPSRVTSSEFRRLRDFTTAWDEILELVVEREAPDDLVRIVREGWKTFPRERGPNEFFRRIITSFFLSMRLKPQAE